MKSRMLKGLAVATVLIPGWFFDSAAFSQEKEIANAHGSFVRKITFARDGSKFATLGVGGIKVWDSDTLKLITSLDFKSRLLADTALSPDGKTLAITGFKEPPGLYDTGSWKIRHKPGLGDTRSVGFAPDSKTVAFAGFNDAILFCDSSNGKHIASIDTGFSLSSLAFSPDGKTLAGSGFPGHIVLWDWPSKKERFKLLGHKGNVHKVVFSPDSETLVTLDLGGSAGPILDRLSRAILWDPATGKKKGEVILKDAMSTPLDAAFSPDSKTLAVVGMGHSILWDVPTDRRLTILERPEMAFDAVAFFPDGKRLVLGNNAGSLFIMHIPKFPDPTIAKHFAQLGHIDSLTRADAALALHKIGKIAVADLMDLRNKTKDETILAHADLVIASLSGKAIDEGAKKQVARAAPAGIDGFVEALIQGRSEGKDATWEGAFQLALVVGEAAQLRGGAKFPVVDFSKFPALVAKNIDEETLADKLVLADAAYFRTGAERCFVVCRRSVVVNHELAKSIVFANGRVTIRGGVKQSIIICAGDV